MSFSRCINVQVFYLLFTTTRRSVQSIGAGYDDVLTPDPEAEAGTGDSGYAF